MIQISISLSSSLNALRDAIATDGTLGPMKRNEQRLFYLGRELKTGNRTLSALGIGNHNVFVLHLHSLAPKMVDLHCDEMGILSKSANWADGEGLSMSRRPFENCLGRMFWFRFRFIKFCLCVFLIYFDLLYNRRLLKYIFIYLYYKNNINNSL